MSDKKRSFEVPAIAGPTASKHISKWRFMLWRLCPRKYYYVGICGMEQETYIGTPFGSEFHFFTDEFFKELVTWTDLEPRTTFDDVFKYLWSLVPRHYSLVVQRYIHYFLELETKRYLQIRRLGLGPKYFFPLETEGEYQTYNKDGTVKEKAIIDRLDLMGDGNIAVIDYKTEKTYRPTSFRSEAAFYRHVIEAVGRWRPRRVTHYVYVNPAIQMWDVGAFHPNTIRALYRNMGKMRRDIDKGDIEAFPMKVSGMCIRCAFHDKCLWEHDLPKWEDGGEKK